jgi:hypothetical protein
VVWKNQTLVEDTLYVGHLTANRHANGRDWWIPVGERNSNAYHTLLFTPEGIQDTFIQVIGDSTLRDGHGNWTSLFFSEWAGIHPLHRCGWHHAIRLRSQYRRTE